MGDHNELTGRLICVSKVRIALGITNTIQAETTRPSTLIWTFSCRPAVEPVSEVRRVPVVRAHADAQESQAAIRTVKLRSDPGRRLFSRDNNQNRFPPALRTRRRGPRRPVQPTLPSPPDAR